MSDVSYMCSEYHPWLVSLGYPLLDISELSDGSWEIIQYHRTPVIPSLTRFDSVLHYMKNIIPTQAFVEKFTRRLDITRKEFWDLEEQKTKEMLKEHDDFERGQEERQQKAYEAIRYNPDLMERIAKGGTQEMTLQAIARHIPRYKF